MEKRPLEEAIDDFGKTMYYHHIPQTSTGLYVTMQENMLRDYDIHPDELRSRVFAAHCKYANRPGEKNELEK